MQAYNKNLQSDKNKVDMAQEASLNNTQGELDTDKKGLYRTSLRIYFAINFMLILCFSCLLAFGLVFAYFEFIYNGFFSSHTTILMIFFTCLLTMTIGGLLMFYGSYHLTRPILIVTDAVKKVAYGDFSIRIFRKTELRKNYHYTNELDELSENFNQMARDLEGMQLMRKDFMNNVSHELQTPVSAIAGISELLLDGGLSEKEETDYLMLLNEESLRLSRLCSNMLQLSRLDNQTIIPNKEEVLVAEQIRQTVILLSEKWSEKEFSFELDLDEIIIFSNMDLIKQIWINLLDNAMKYSSAHSMIKITAKLQGDTLQVMIKDQGIGIEAEKIEHIFDQFYQCDESHKKIGNGLGLSIVKRIVELYHGDITCESVMHHGTTMTVRLPNQKVKEQSE